MSSRFGSKLQYLRQQSGLSQTQLAKELSVSRGHIANLEVMRKEPSLEFVLLASNFFGVTTDYLIRDTISTEDISRYTLVDSAPNTSPRISLGARIRELRTKQGLTQHELSQKLGLQTQAHISLLEGNNKSPSVELVLKIADVFRVSVDSVLRYDSIPTGSQH